MLQGRLLVLGRILKWTAIALGTVLLVIALLIAALLWYIHDGVFRMDRFDPKAWLEPPSREREFTCYRGGMAGDVRSRVLKPGMRFEEVKAILGDPDGGSANESRYILGLCSGFRIDYDILHLYFDYEGKLVASAVLQH